MHMGVKISSGSIDEVDHLTTDQRLKVAEVAALLSISQELSGIRHGGINPEYLNRLTKHRADAVDCSPFLRVVAQHHLRSPLVGIPRLVEHRVPSEVHFGEGVGNA
jgi:hypothetical protein